jgi:hypothetical protein
MRRRGSTTTTPLPTQPWAAGARHNIKVGAAADSPYLATTITQRFWSEFSQLQAENEMKFAIIHPGVNTYDSAAAMPWFHLPRHIPWLCEAIPWFGTIRFRMGHIWKLRFIAAQPS